MDISGSYTFDALPDRVWDLLMDPEAIAPCIPGCHSFEPEGEDRYRARLTIALAAVTGAYEGVVVLSDKIAQTSYRLTGEGQGHAGFLKGTSEVTLRAAGDATLVDVKATIQVGGAIARVGQRLVGSVSKMMLDRFFACLKAKVSAKQN
jgi:carbon monoxide dehydrogenase subunit G